MSDPQGPGGRDGDDGGPPATAPPAEPQPPAGAEGEPTDPGGEPAGEPRPEPQLGRLLLELVRHWAARATAPAPGDAPPADAAPVEPAPAPCAKLGDLSRAETVPEDERVRLLRAATEPEAGPAAAPGAGEDAASAPGAGALAGSGGALDAGCDAGGDPELEEVLPAGVIDLATERLRRRGASQATTEPESRLGASVRETVGRYVREEILPREGEAAGPIRLDRAFLGRHLPGLLSAFLGGVARAVDQPPASLPDGTAPDAPAAELPGPPPPPPDPAPPAVPSDPVAEPPAPDASSTTVQVDLRLDLTPWLQQLFGPKEPGST